MTEYGPSYPPQPGAYPPVASHVMAPNGSYAYGAPPPVSNGYGPPPGGAVPIATGQPMPYYPNYNAQQQHGVAQDLSAPQEIYAAGGAPIHSAPPPTEAYVSEQTRPPYVSSIPYSPDYPPQAPQVAQQTGHGLVRNVPFSHATVSDADDVNSDGREYTVISRQGPADDDEASLTSKRELAQLDAIKLEHQRRFQAEYTNAANALVAERTKKYQQKAVEQRKQIEAEAHNLRRSHDMTIQDAKQAYKRRSKQMMEEHAAMLEKLQTDHEQKMKRLSQEHTIQIAQREQSFEEQVKRLHLVEKKHMSEVEQSNRKIQAFLQRVGVDISSPTTPTPLGKTAISKQDPNRTMEQFLAPVTSIVSPPVRDTSTILSRKIAYENDEEETLETASSSTEEDGANMNSVTAANDDPELSELVKELPQKDKKLDSELSADRPSMTLFRYFAHIRLNIPVDSLMRIPLADVCRTFRSRGIRVPVVMTRYFPPKWEETFPEVAHYFIDLRAGRIQESGARGSGGDGSSVPNEPTPTPRRTIPVTPAGIIPSSVSSATSSPISQTADTVPTQFLTRNVEPGARASHTTSTHSPAPNATVATGTGTSAAPSFPLDPIPKQTDFSAQNPFMNLFPGFMPSAKSNTLSSGGVAALPPPSLGSGVGGGSSLMTSASNNNGLSSMLKSLNESYRGFSIPPPPVAPVDLKSVLQGSSHTSFPTHYGGSQLYRSHMTPPLKERHRTSIDLAESDSKSPVHDDESADGDVVDADEQEDPNAEEEDDEEEDPSTAVNARTKQLFRAPVTGEKRPVSTYKKVGASTKTGVKKTANQGTTKPKVASSFTSAPVSDPTHKKQAAAATTGNKTAPQKANKKQSVSQQPPRSPTKTNRLVR
jgi:hypothetical protein